ncbi:MAG: hypothetical protein A2293_13560 [Elusimicrobia bacterium RIFOXYB2_FULL_49_7]|nr:MAG: hypothetical protein A2293_13560 [Elusimicrobia bacterium RIFOXYB2_FULL_49_7]
MFRPLLPNELNHEKIWFWVFLGALLLFKLIPIDSVALISCPIKNLIGLPCPTCGITRTVIAISEGKVEEAFTTSPFFALAFLGCGVYGLYAGVAMIFQTRRIRLVIEQPWKRYYPGMLLALVLVMNWLWLVFRGI